MVKYRLLMFVGLMISVVPAQENLKSRLLNYDYNRLKINSAAKSLIIDYIKNETLDSIDFVIDFCDSLNVPNKAWLDAHERLILKIIQRDIQFLSDLQFYKEFFNLTDTVPTYHPDFIYDYYDTYESYPSPFSPPRPIEENLERFLELTFEKDKQKIHESFIAYPDLWAFLEILLVANCCPPDTRPLVPEKGADELAHEFLKTYPKSKFYKLVLYNFSNYLNNNRSGGLLGIAVAYDVYPEQTNRLIPDHPQLGLTVNYYTKRFSFLFLGKIWTTHTNSTINYSLDTLKKGSDLNTGKVRLALGYLVGRYSSYYFSPYIGYEWFFPFKPKEDKGKGEIYDLPNSGGLSIGLQIEEKEEYDFIIWSLNIGYSFIRTRNIRSDLDNNYFFIELGIGLGGWDQERYFPQQKN